ncbi:MAG: hypothetical protein ACRCZS_00795 [Chroococcidiopsis sp.]
MAKYGRYYESKKAEQGTNRTFLIIILTPLLLGVFGGLSRWMSGAPVSDASSTSCIEVQREWKTALDARDAITPSEAVTEEGRARWERLRDRANELEIIVDGRCN